uniref:Uncharacterized protein n=2 Tax=Oryza TaxID=4527 RepID=A0A0D3GUE4_9ORYZ
MARYVSTHNRLHDWFVGPHEGREYATPEMRKTVVVAAAAATAAGEADAATAAPLGQSAHHTWS